MLEGEVTVARRQRKDSVEPDAEPTSGSKQFSLPSIIPKPSLPSPKPVSSPSPDDTNLINPTFSNDEDQTDQIVLKAGEKVNISATGAPGLIEKLTQKDFTNLLTGNLFNGFTIPLPGMTKIQASFQQLFPGVPFPIQLPRLPTLPIPIRLPF